MSTTGRGQRLLWPPITSLACSVLRRPTSIQQQAVLAVPLLDASVAQASQFDAPCVCTRGTRRVLSCCAVRLNSLRPWLPGLAARL